MVFWKYPVSLQKNALAEIRCESEVLCKFIEIAFWHGCSSINLLHILSTIFPKNTSGELFLFFLRKEAEFLKKVSLKKLLMLANYTHTIECVHLFFILSTYTNSWDIFVEIHVQFLIRVKIYHRTPLNQSVSNFLWTHIWRFTILTWAVFTKILFLTEN